MTFQKLLLLLLGCVALAAVAVSAQANTNAADAGAAAAGNAAPAVDLEALFQQYHKAQRKVAELEALHAADAAAAAAAAPAADDAHAAAGVDTTTSATKTSRHVEKNARKVEEKRAHVAQLRALLESHGVDVVAKERELAERAAHDARLQELEGQFAQVWIQKLQRDGRTAEAEKESNKLAGIKTPKAMLSPEEKAKQKIDKLRVKLEREEFRLSWLAEQMKQAPATGTAATA